MNLISKFNFSVDVQHFDAQNSIRCEKNMQFTTIRSTCNIAKHF